jgi:hypothetical protein
VDSPEGRTRKILVASLLAVLLLLASAPSSLASWHARDVAGAALHPWRLETRTYAPLWPLRDSALRDRTFAKLQSAGIRHARVDLQWSRVEPHGPLLPGGLPAYHDWSEFDATVVSARAHHVQLDPVVSFTPSWANGGRGPFAYPTNPATFQEFMAAAMKRYPDIPAWEIWNEPNTEPFSPPKPDPARFVAMLQAAARARLAARSHALIVTGGLAPGADGSLSPFAERIARLGAFRYADALGVHPYSAQRADEDGSAFLRLPKLHEQVSNLAGRSVDLWVTEYGYPNFPSHSTYGPPADEHGQASRLARAFALAAGWPWLKRLTWYGFRDDCSAGGHPDCRFGLLRENFSDKAAWHTYLDVLAGRLPRLDTRITIHRRSKLKGRRRHRKRVHTLYGRLLMPGTDPARGRVMVIATRRIGKKTRRRRVRTTLKDGDYRVSLGRLRSGRWRFAAKFAGDSRYEPVTSRLLKARVRKPRHR